MTLLFIAKSNTLYDIHAWDTDDLYNFASTYLWYAVFIALMCMKSM